MDIVENIFEIYEKIKIENKFIYEYMPNILYKFDEIISYPQMNLQVVMDLKNLKKLMIELKNTKKIYEYIDRLSIILTVFDKVLVRLNIYYVSTGDIHVSTLKIHYLDFYFIIEDYYKIYNEFHIYLNTLLKLKEQIKRNVDKESSMIDNIHKKTFYELFQRNINYDIIYESNIIEIDEPLKEICSLILKIKKEYDSIFENYQYYEMRKEKTIETWKTIKDEFFEICYRPDLFKKIVLDEKEVSFFN